MVVCTRRGHAHATDSRTVNSGAGGYTGRWHSDSPAPKRDLRDLMDDLEKEHSHDLDSLRAYLSRLGYPDVRLGSCKTVIFHGPWSACLIPSVSISH